MLTTLRATTVRGALGEVYRTANYSVRWGRRDVRIEPGQRSVWLDRLLKHSAAHTWCFITAHNPRSRRHTPWRNRAADARLQRVIRRGRWRAFQGVSGGAGWSEETSYLVLDVTPPQARRLGLAFRQNAVLIGKRGGAARLLWCARA